MTKEEIENDLELSKEREHAAHELKVLEFDLEKERLLKQIELDKLKNEREEEIFEAGRNSYNTKSFVIQNEVDSHNAAHQKRMNEVEAKNSISKGRRDRIFGWFKLFLLFLITIFLILLLATALYRVYRWVVEEPLIKHVEVEKIVEKEVEVEKIVEVEVEKIVEKEVEVEVEKIVEKEVEVEVEKIVEKEVEVEVEVEKVVVPEECTQIRRNGKIFINCDGVKIDGVSTLEESGLENIPELLTD